jgi:hypothetical protein
MNSGVFYKYHAPELILIARIVPIFMLGAYKFLVIGAVAAIAIIGGLTAVSLSKGTISTHDYEIDVDPFKDPQNLFVTARVMVQNTGTKPLTNVEVDYGDGDPLKLGTLSPGQKVILSPPADNPLQFVTVSADNGIMVTKQYRIPPKMPGMMGS